VINKARRKFINSSSPDPARIIAGWRAVGALYQPAECVGNTAIHASSAPLAKALPSGVNEACPTP
jgi:hypothetical protein